MAIRYWVGAGGTTNWSDTGNWGIASGGAGGYSVPSTGDSAIFDGGSAKTCDLVWNIVIGSVTMSAYNGTFNTNNYAVVVENSWSTAGMTGTLNMGSSLWTFDTATFNFSAGTINRGTSTVLLQGTCNIAGAASKYLHNLLIAASGSATATNLVGVLNNLTLQNNSTLTINSGITLTVDGAVSVGTGAQITGLGLLDVFAAAAGKGITTLAGSITVTSLRLLNWTTDGTLTPGTYGSPNITVKCQSSGAQTLRLSAGTYHFLGATSNTFTLTTWGAGSMTLDAQTNGAGLYIDGNFTITPNGATTALSGNLAVQGSITRNAGTFTKTAGTLILSGTPNANLPDITSGAISIVKSSPATVTVTANLTAASLMLNPIIAPITLDVAGYDITLTGAFTIREGARITGVGGSVITAGSIDWRGTEAAPLDLAPTGDWLLTVSTSATVHYADVQYSNASGGVAILAINCDNQGGNRNWLFMTTTYADPTGDVYTPGPAAADTYSPGSAQSDQFSPGAAAVQIHVP